MGLPAGTARLKRHTSFTVEFDPRTISPVPDISHTHSPTTSGCQCERTEELVRCCETCRRTGLRDAAPATAPPPPPPPPRPPPPAAPPLVVAPADFQLPTPAEVVTGPVLLGRTVLYYWPGDGWVRGTVARRSQDPRVLARGPVRPSVGAGCPLWYRDGRFDARCRLARAGRQLSPAVPDALTGPLLVMGYGSSGSGRVGTRIVGCSPDKPMQLISSSHKKQYKAEGFSRQRIFISMNRNEDSGLPGHLSSCHGNED